MRSPISTLLLAALMALTLVLAVPVPMSDDELQARWNRGESEVCCSTNGAGCYVLAWWRSLSVRNGQAIHAAQTYRDATPAWRVRGRDSAEESVFSFATDERTMASRYGKRETPLTPKLLAKMKAFVKAFYRNRGQAAPVARSEEAGMAPVLKPKRGWEYRFRG